MSLCAIPAVSFSQINRLLSSYWRRWRVQIEPPIQHDILYAVMNHLSSVDVLKCGRVCRLWREISEAICKKRYEQEFGEKLQITPALVLPTYHASYAYSLVLCRERGNGWAKKETHPPTLWATREFIKPGKTDIVMDSLSAPVEFQEVHIETYLVQCDVKARLVTLPLITLQDPYKRSLPILRDFPEELGAICQIARGNQVFYVLAENKIHVLSQDLIRMKSLDISDAQALASSGELLVAGTHEGKLIGWNEGQRVFSQQIGKGPFSWLNIYSRGERRIVIAIQDQELIIVRNFFANPRIKRIPFLKAKGCKPFLHGSYFIWKSPEGFRGIDLVNDEEHVFPQWIYASPVAGGQLLVQNEKREFFLLDEEMKSSSLGSLTMPVKAADFRNGFLLVALDPSNIYLYRKEGKDLCEIYYNSCRTVAGEKIVQVNFNVAGTIVYSTNNGRFIYGCPLFEGLSPKEKQEIFQPPASNVCILV